jgi:hypothetical protein
MASEDSDQFGSGFLTVHRSDDFEQIRQSVSTAMMTLGHPLDADGELFEVVLFGTPEWVGPEKRDDDGEEIRSPRHLEIEEMLAVVVVPCIPIHRAHPEESVQLPEASNAPRSLRHHK